MLTEGMTSEEILEFARTRPEVPWHWGHCFFIGASPHIKNKADTEALAKDLGVKLLWTEPIREGDLYLGARNTGPQLLTCRELGEACVFPVEMGYPFDFSECVKIEE